LLETGGGEGRIESMVRPGCFLLATIVLIVAALAVVVMILSYLSG
jgi:hypothetical protein